MYSSEMQQTKAAQERMEEMRQLIGRRQFEGESTPRSRTRSVFDSPTRSITPSNSVLDASRSIDVLVADADRDLAKAASSQQTLQNDLKHVSVGLKEVCS